MKITIEINADNAAFEGADCGPELARILATLARRLKDLDAEGVADADERLRDLNGNTVGHFIVTGYSGHME